MLKYNSRTLPHVAGRSSVLVLILAFAALGSLLFSSDLPNRKNWSINYPTIIPVEPKVSQAQAFETSQKDLQEKMGGLEGVRIQLGFYNYSRQRDENNPDYSNYIMSNNLGRGYPLADAGHHPELLNLPLFFIRPNGTAYAIEPTSQVVTRLCNTAVNWCPLNPAAAKAGRGHLFYVVALTFKDLFKDLSETGYLIDAENGMILWDSISYRENRNLERK